MDKTKPYTDKILHSYLWQGLTAATSLFSMFVVLPLLSSQPTIFGVYSLCMSLSIFLTYADFGFANAGFRYASQSFVAADLKREAQTIGFVSFMLLIFVFLYAAAVCILALRPGWLIADISNEREAATAKSLLLALAFFSPTIVLQRMLQIIFGIRVEDYVYQRLFIIGNLLKVASVFVFITASAYDIVGYYITSQVIALASCMASFWVARRRYEYDLPLLFRSIRFSREMFDDTKTLAFSSLYVTLAWVAYFEFDSVFIGSVLGARALAVYAVALSVSQGFRTLLSLVFAPFRARINHFAADGEEQRLAQLYQRILVVTLPVTVFPVVSLVLLMDPFIRSWVGEQYVLSIFVSQCLTLYFIDGFNSNPVGYLLVAKARVRELLVIGTAAPLILWSGVLLGWQSLDVKTFAILKAIAAVPALCFGLALSHRLLKASQCSLFKTVLAPALLPVLALIMMSIAVRPYLPETKSIMSLSVVIMSGATASAVASLIYYFSSGAFRAAVNPILQRIVAS
jgi:O-antigen/teichoic acid export membrane protein